MFELVTVMRIEKGSRPYQRIETVLSITQSLKRCADYAKRDSSGSREGLKRAFAAARERIVLNRGCQTGIKAEMSLNQRLEQRARKIAERQRFVPSVKNPDSLLESSAIVVTEEVLGPVIKVVEIEGGTKKVRAKARVVYDASMGTSRIVAGGRDEPLGLSQVRRISTILYRRALGAIGADARRIRQRHRTTKNKNKS